MNGRPVSGIGGGLNEGIAPSEVPMGSYLLGENVRGICSMSGRFVWGAQRAGLSNDGDQHTDGYPTCFAAAFRQVRGREWYELTNVAETSTVPQQVEEAWTLDLDTAALDVSVGPDGQAYYLLEDGNVSVVNQKGREVEVVRSAARAFYKAVPRIEVAEDGSLFVAETNTRDDELPRGYISRWVRQEDDTWTRAWEQSFEAPIAMFGYRLNALYVALEPQKDENDVLPPAELAYISAPLVGPEILWKEGDIPRPVLDVQVNERGQAILSCPSNPDRAVVNAGFGVRSVNWTPSQETQWDLNGWAWVDAFHVNESSTGLDNGAEVSRMRDRRFEETTFDQPDDTSPTRELTAPKGGIIAAPTYDATAFGGLGGVKFDSRTALVSQFNDDSTDQSVNEGLIPSGRLNGTGSSYICAMIVQFSEEQMTATTQRRILSQTNTGAVSEPDWEMVTDTTTGSRVSLDDGGGTATALSPAGDATTRVSILSWYHDDSANTIAWYHDGTLVGTTAATVRDPDQGGPFTHATGFSDVQMPGPFTVIGGALPNRVNLITAPGTVGLSSEGTAIGANIEVLRDGVRAPNGSSSIWAMGSVLGAGVQLNRWVEVDFGSDIPFDSVNLWLASLSGSTFPTTLTLAWSNQATGSLSGGATPNGYVNVAPTAGDAADDFAQNAFELSTSGGNHRYLMMAMTSGYAGGAAVTGSLASSQVGLRMTELEVFFQNLNVAGTTDDTAGFTLGEFVAKSAAQGGGSSVDEERQRIEGYIAHRFGVQAQLDGLHPHLTVAPFGAGSTAPQDKGQIESALRSTDPILAKYGTDGQPLAAYAGAGVGLGAVVEADDIYTVGEVMATPTPNFGEMLQHFTDDGYRFDRQAGFTAGTEDPAVKTTRLVLGPQDTLYLPYQPAVGTATGANSIRRYESDLSAALWTLATTQRPNAIAAGGAVIDESQRNGATGVEFLYGAFDGTGSHARRVTTLGLRDTGQEPGRTREELRVLSTGDVVRKNATDGWDVLEAAALAGKRPAAATLYGKTFFADGLAYRVYDHETGQLRDFEEAVAGDFPPRCRLIAAYRGRLVLAAGDNAFTIYQSRFGDPFDFDYGPEVQTISQAIAGTTASQGNVPSPITALMPVGEDFLYIGTADGLFIQTGDLADGGRLDQVDKSHGVAFGYAWCESPRGLYYFSGKGGVMLVRPGVRPSSVSDGKIARRLEEVDLSANRVELAYNWLDKTVHVFVIPNDLGSDTEHYAYEEPTGAWHIDTYGDGYERAVTAVGVQEGDTPESRSIMLGFADGYGRRWDQYAVDDAGNPVRSAATIGPLIPGPQGVETHLMGVYGQLATDQDGIEVGVRASQSADAPGPAGQFQPLSSGRGFGVGVNACAPAVFIEVRGTGRSWAVHELRAEAAAEGHSRAS